MALGGMPLLEPTLPEETLLAGDSTAELEQINACASMPITFCPAAHAPARRWKPSSTGASPCAFYECAKLKEDAFQGQHQPPTALSRFRADRA